MHRLPDELQLVVLLAVNAFVIVAAIRFARRRGVNDGPQVALDAMLIWYLVQYISVGLPGLLGFLAAEAMCAAAIVAGLMLLTVPKRPQSALDAIDGRAVLLCGLLVCAFAAAAVWNQRLVPPTANDALTYHLPAAVHWLQTGKLGLFQTWYFNPANTYSPLAGSMFVAWLLGPLGNDAIAQFVEAPALLMIFLALLQLCRALGARVTTASIIALAACVSRPFISQTVLTKDDLFVTAFFATAVVGFATSQAAWRVGVALGLLLAAKYTALLSLPVLLLAFDAPARSGWGWRQHLAALIVALLIAGPWYLRNAIVTGNPLFPVDVTIGRITLLHGMFSTQGMVRGGPKGIWHTLAQSYASLPPVVVLTLIALWITAFIRVAATLVRQPLQRLVLLGPVLGVVLFVLYSPYAEVRFVYPSFLLLFASAAIALGGLERNGWDFWLAIMLAVIGVATSFVPAVLLVLSVPAIIASLVLIVSSALVCNPRTRTVSVGALTLLLLGMVYVFWQAHLNARRETEAFWRGTYGPIADGWAFLREKELSPGTTIAYAHTHFVYPLTGPELDRRVIYAPTRAGVRSIADLGRVGLHVKGEDLEGAVTNLMTRDADKKVWLTNLRDSGAKYLFINDWCPERDFAKSDPHFVAVFDNAEQVIYEVRW